MISQRFAENRLTQAHTQDFHTRGRASGASPLTENPVNHQSERSLRGSPGATHLKSCVVPYQAQETFPDPKGALSSHEGT